MNDGKGYPGHFRPEKTAPAEKKILQCVSKKGPLPYDYYDITSPVHNVY